MATKIRYRLVWNYSGRLNKDLLAPVALECRQGNRKMYISSKVMLSEGQWHRGMVINHENADKLTAYLIHWRNSVEKIEIDALLKGRHLTLRQMKEAVKDNIRQGATFRQFTDAVVQSDSSRCTSTRRSYAYLVNDIEREYGEVTMEDIDYDFIIRFREAMRKRGLSENTVRGKLKAMRCIMEQARLRDIIDRNPFERITIGNIGCRMGGLTISEVRRMERLELHGMEGKVRDLFLLGCYTGLRYSDLSTLEEATISNGIMRKVMHKTHHEVVLPIRHLFGGKPLEIMERYPDITRLSHCCSNTQANRIIKDIASKARIRKRVYFHLARKTFGQMLSALGMDMPAISALMGHTDSKVTKAHYVFNEESRIEKSVKRIFKDT